MAPPRLNIDSSLADLIYSPKFRKVVAGISRNASRSQAALFQERRRRERQERQHRRKQSRQSSGNTKLANQLCKKFLRGECAQVGPCPHGRKHRPDIRDQRQRDRHAAKGRKPQKARRRQDEYHGRKAKRRRR